MLQVRLGGLDEVPFVLGEGGERLVLVEGVEREVVVATARDLVESGFGSSVSDGVFLTLKVSLVLLVLVRGVEILVAEGAPRMEGSQCDHEPAVRCIL